MFVVFFSGTVDEEGTATHVFEAGIFLLSASSRTPSNILLPQSTDEEKNKMCFSLLSSALAARQLVVPTFSESATSSATEVVSILSVPKMQTVIVPARPFTLGHGPVVVSTASTPDRQWTTDHGPVMVSPTIRPSTTGHSPVMFPRPTSTASSLPSASPPESNAASTLATVIRHSPTTLKASTTTHIASGGYSSLFSCLLTDCHDDDRDYIYFTLLSPNGSLALDSKGKRGLYFIKTQWYLTYTQTIRKALFNDTEHFLHCPEGYCRSTIIPSTDLRSELVKNPKVFRAGWDGGRCGYMDNTQAIGKNFVTRGKFGYLHTGAILNSGAVAFVEQRLLDTFPTLEIGLVLGFTVGLFVGLPLLLFFCVWFYHFVWRLVEGVKGCGRELGARVIVAVRAVSAGISAGVERCGAKVQNALSKRTDRKCRDSGQGEQFPDTVPFQHSPNSAYVAAPPPAYTYV